MVSDQPATSDNPPSFAEQAEQATARTDSENNAKEDTDNDLSTGDDATEEEASKQNINAANDAPGPAVDGLACPPDVDPEVFASLPLDIQQEIIAEAEVQEQKADPANAEGESSFISREMSSSIHV